MTELTLENIGKVRLTFLHLFQLLAKTMLNVFVHAYGSIFFYFQRNTSRQHTIFAVEHTKHAALML